MIAAARPDVSVNESVLDVAFELGKKEWKLAMTSGFGMPPWLRTVASGGPGRGRPRRSHWPAAIWASGDGARRQLL